MAKINNTFRDIDICIGIAEGVSIEELGEKYSIRPDRVKEVFKKIIKIAYKHMNDDEIEGLGLLYDRYWRSGVKRNKEFWVNKFNQLKVILPQYDIARELVKQMSNTCLVDCYKRFEASDGDVYFSKNGEGFWMIKRYALGIIDKEITIRANEIIANEKKGIK